MICDIVYIPHHVLKRHGTFQNPVVGDWSKAAVVDRCAISFLGVPGSCRGYSRLQQVGIWTGDDLGCVPSLPGLGPGGQWYSNFLASTVISWLLVA